VAKGRYKGKTGKRNGLKTFLFFLILALGAASWFLYQQNKKMKGELKTVRREKSQLDDRVRELQSEIKQKEAELAEMKIQAVIKDAGTQK